MTFTRKHGDERTDEAGWPWSHCKTFLERLAVQGYAAVTIQEYRPVSLFRRYNRETRLSDQRPRRCRCGTPAAARGAERVHLSSDSVQQTRDRGARCPVAQPQIFKFIFRDRVAQPFDLKQRRRQLREVGRGRTQ